MSGFKGHPWRWDDSYSTIDGRNTWSLVTADGFGILSCDGNANSPQETGFEREARLISAAPELLSSLEFAVKLLSGLPHVGGTAQLEHMRSVIAKATGGDA